MRKAESLYPGQPFRIITDLGEVVMLPPELADEIRNESKLSFSAAIAIVSFKDDYKIAFNGMMYKLMSFPTAGLPFQCASIRINNVECAGRADNAKYCEETTDQIAL